MCADQIFERTRVELLEASVIIGQGLVHHAEYSPTRMICFWYHTFIIAKGALVKIAMVFCVKGSLRSGGSIGDHYG